MRSVPIRRSAAGRTHEGFTLVEVLATIVLVAIVIPVALRGVSVATRTAAAAAHRSEAAGLAESMLNTLVATGQVSAGELSGDFSPERPDYTWTAEVSEYDGSSMLQVDLHVKWTEGAMPRSVTVSTLVYLSQTQ